MSVSHYLDWVVVVVVVDAGRTLEMAGRRRGREPSGQCV